MTGVPKRKVVRSAALVISAGIAVIWWPFLVDLALYGSRAAIGVKACDTPPYQSKRSVYRGGDLSFAERKSALRFPNVADCTKKAGGAERPDLPVLDVGALGNEYDVAVCAFRIMASLSDIDAAARWMAAESLTSRGGGEPSVWKTRMYSKSATGRLVGSPGVRLDGSWSESRGGFRFSERNVLARPLSGLAYGFSVRSMWSADGKSLIWLKAGYLYK